MAIADASLYPQARQALSQSAPATAGQLVALKAELDNDPTGRGYKNADGSFKAIPTLSELLNTPFGMPNPEAQGTVPVGYLPRGVVLVLANKFKAKKFALLAQGQTVPETLSYIVDDLMPATALQDGLDLTQPQVQQMIAAIKQMGLLTEEETAELTTKPDPAYVAILPQDAPAKALCGIAEVADIVVALAS